MEIIKSAIVKVRKCGKIQYKGKTRAYLVLSSKYSICFGGMSMMSDEDKVMRWGRCLWRLNENPENAENEMKI